MAKRFFYVCSGVLLLSISWVVMVGSLSDPEPARAQGEGGVVALLTDFDPGSGEEGYSGRLLLSDGSVWAYNWQDAEQPFVEDYTSPTNPWGTFPLPVPLDEVQFWAYRTLVTQAGEVWILAPAVSPYGRRWANLGAPPGAPVRSPAGSVSTLKRSYGGND